MNDQDIKNYIAIWKEALTKYKHDYEIAVRYDDYGAKETASEMIKYSQRKIDELELSLTKKGA